VPQLPSQLKLKFSYLLLRTRRSPKLDIGVLHVTYHLASTQSRERVSFHVAKHARMFIACKTVHLCKSIWSKFAQDYAQIPSSAVPLHPYLTLSREYTLTQETTACLRNLNALGTGPLHLQRRHSQALTCGSHRHQASSGNYIIPLPAQLSGPNYM
jgi:hypothetical protein